MSKIIGVTVGTPLNPSEIKKKMNLTDYATEQFVREFAQPKGEYLTKHQDISGKLDANKLPEAINDALAQAKASGEFDGKDGRTPVKGVDYFDGTDGKTPVKGEDYYTETDKEEIVNRVLEEIEIPDVSVEIPTFDLAAMGMTAVTLPVGSASIETDTTALISALSAGAVRFAIPTIAGTYSVDMHGVTDGSGGYQCVAFAMMNAAVAIMVNVVSGAIQVLVIPLATAIGIPSVTTADNGKLMQVVDGAWAAIALQDVSEVGE